MKLTTVLSAVNLNPEYYLFLPYQIRFWAKFGCKFICVLVAESIPDELKNYSEHIVLWNHTPELHSAYVGQNIRLYYPALLDLPDDEIVMITDMDMMPLNAEYYKTGIENFTKDDFICYHDVCPEYHKISMCYNASHPNTWAKLFSINSLNDVIKLLRDNFATEYTGVPMTQHWNIDQLILVKFVLNYPKSFFLKKKVRRLEMWDCINRINNGNVNFLSLYDDGHFHRSYSKNKPLIDYVEKLLPQSVSGSEFHRISKWSFCPRYPVKVEPGNIQLNDMLFLNLDYLPQFLNSLRQQPPKNKFVLISHNSDQKFTEAHFNAISPFVTHIYAINCVYQHPMITPIPIGFVDDKYKPHSTFEIVKTMNYEKNNLLYMNFAIGTNPEKRNECWSVFENQEWVLKEKDLPLDEFYTQIAKSKYILSPEGTGIDCHRIYESMLLGSVPVLKTSQLDYFYKTLPVMIVNDWSEITKEFLEENWTKYKTALDDWKNANPNWLKPEYWITRNWNGRICSNCGKQCEQQCSGCKKVFYCGRECQFSHWNVHRNFCR